MENIDNLAYSILLILLFSAVICPSEIMGGISLIFSFLMIFKFIFFSNKIEFKLFNYEKTFIVYFLLVTLSLFASSLFSLSLHGYIKTFIYALFFLAASFFFKDNKNKIFPTIIFVTCLMSYESIIALIQNMSGVSEISGWQDTSHINSEEIISRAYGTLKPYNPNLLAGYLLCGLSSIMCLIVNNLKQSRKKFALLFTGVFLLNFIAIILTGCRGAYLGFMLFFPTLLFALIYHVNKNMGGLLNVKKRYKNIFIASTIGAILFILSNPALTKRFQTIFALRGDSSISFRLNVYESAWNMFLDNPFLGIGIGNQNFREIYGLYMKTGYDALGAYCVPLEIAVESGIVTLIAFLLFLLLIILKCIKFASQKDKTNKDKIICLGVVLLIAATMGHGIFDTVWFRPQLQFLFWTNLAFLRGIFK